MKNLNKARALFRAIRKKLKLRYVILLIVLLSTNTFAWFIYAQQVESDLTVSVRAWKVLFESEDSPITDYVDINVEDIFPGMEDFNYEIKAYNRSDIAAKLTYTVLVADIMGDSYVSVEGKQDSGLELDGTEFTSEEIVTMLSNDYPFKITMGLSSSEIEPGYGEATYDVSLVWPYESGDDEADTYWGMKAYDFRENNPDTSCISLKVKISISQIEGA